MFLDTHQLPDGDPLEAELCIVGAGAAGITLALGLLQSGIDVLLLEAGGLRSEDISQAAYDGDLADERLHTPLIRYRERRFGGTTTIWGGRCNPFDPIDFEVRDYVPHSGWPLDYASLLPFYRQANALCEAGAFAYRAQEAFRRPLPPMLAGFESTHFTTDTLERFSCPTDFGRRYAHKLAAARNVRVLLHASVTHLQLAPAGDRVTNLVVRNHRGGQWRVRARRFVLATGGLEVVRLLLASRDVQPAGIGNEHDVVGRYYMCHMAATFGRIKIEGVPTNVWHGYDLADEGVYCRRRLALRPEVQRSMRLANFIARLHHPRIADPAHRNATLSLLYLARPLVPYEYARRLIDDESVRSGGWLRHVRNVAAAPHEAIRFAVQMLNGRKLAERKFPSIIVRSKANLYGLELHAEQYPNPGSRVMLSDRRDTLGVPRLLVDWRYTPDDVRTSDVAMRLLAEDLRRAKVGRLEYDPNAIEAELTRHGAYGGHHIGTARMGTDPLTSVVDCTCRVHSVENLYIASAATFPTSSQANPTLTVVALSLRLAQHLGGLRDPVVTAPLESVHALAD